MSNPSVSVDFGIAAMEFEGTEDDSFEEVMGEVRDYFEADTFEGVVRTLKSMDFELEREYPDVETGSASPQGGTFQ
jgi:hypothetical protein